METETRKVADCRNYPSEKNCTLTIAGSEEEVLDASVDHAVNSHDHERTPELREEIRGLLTDEPAARPGTVA
jgi:hypothetical protein